MGRNLKGNLVKNHGRFRRIPRPFRESESSSSESNSSSSDSSKSPIFLITKWNPKNVAPRFLNGGSNKNKSLVVSKEYLSFDWRLAAAEYINRTKMMQDYLIFYIDALASYRNVREESIDNLMILLISRSSNPPPLTDMATLMPPSISGLVANKTMSDGTKLEEDFSAILSRRPDLFQVTGSRVKYLSRRSSEEARVELKRILVEGIFLYFFAKFCHEDKFSIKVAYYEKSEPVRSCLIEATGINDDIKSALEVYFGIYPTIFDYDSTRFSLQLVHRYYDSKFRQELKTYLTNFNKDLKLQLSNVKATVILKLSDDRYLVRIPENSYALLVGDNVKKSLSLGTNILMNADSCEPKVLKNITYAWSVTSYKIDENDLRNQIGRVKIISEKTGVLTFTTPESMVIREAYFMISDIIIGKPGHKVTTVLPLEYFIEEGSKVVFNAFRVMDIPSKDFYKCTKIQLLDVDLDKSLVIFEASNRILGEPDFEDEFGRLVRSTVQNVLMNDVVSRSIIDINVLRSLSQSLGFEMRQKDFFQLEYCVRKLLAIKVIKS